MTKVIDTNVALVTKHPEEHPLELVDACQELLEAILSNRSVVVTDDGGEIVEEYFHQLNHAGQPSLGDAFARYVHDHRFTWDQSARPDIQPDSTTENSYAVLRCDDADIDPSDRKFVATAKVAGVPIHQATDTKWLNWGDVLDRHGVRVIYVHAASIRAAYEAKFGHPAP